MVSLPPDADVHGDIVRGFLRPRPDLDLVRVQDVFPPGTPDPDVLEWAAAEGRVLVTQDVNTMVGHAWARVRAGQPLPGVLVCGPKLTIDQLELAARAGGLPRPGAVPPTLTDPPLSRALHHRAAGMVARSA